MYYTKRFWRKRLREVLFRHTHCPIKFLVSLIWRPWHTKTLSPSYEKKVSYTCYIYAYIIFVVWFRRVWYSFVFDTYHTDLRWIVFTHIFEFTGIPSNSILFIIIIIIIVFFFWQSVFHLHISVSVFLDPSRAA